MPSTLDLGLQRKFKPGDQLSAQLINKMLEAIYTLSCVSSDQPVLINGSGRHFGSAAAASNQVFVYQTQSKVGETPPYPTSGRFNTQYWASLVTQAEDGSSTVDNDDQDWVRNLGQSYIPLGTRIAVFEIDGILLAFYDAGSSLQIATYSTDMILPGGSAYSCRDAIGNTITVNNPANFVIHPTVPFWVQPKVGSNYEIVSGGQQAVVKATAVIAPGGSGSVRIQKPHPIVAGAFVDAGGTGSTPTCYDPTGQGLPNGNVGLASYVGRWVLGGVGCPT